MVNPNNDKNRKQDGKLIITPGISRGPGKGFDWLPSISVLFNPESYTVSKSVNWSSSNSTSGETNKTHRKTNAPPQTFGGGGKRSISVELFFDVTDKVTGAKNQTNFPDVREVTKPIVDLTRIEQGKQGKTEPPKVCRLSWGDTDLDFDFIGVITNLTQKFTLFASNGRPLRATLSVTFSEFSDPELDQRKTDPQLTTRIVRRGDSLSAIAAEFYRDPTRWRLIAEANHLSDPRHLDGLIGQRLVIPSVD